MFVGEARSLPYNGPPEMGFQLGKLLLYFVEETIGRKIDTRP